LGVNELDRALGIGKRYAARVFHNWSKEARVPALPRFVLKWFSLGVGLHEGLRLRAVPGGWGSEEGRGVLIIIHKPSF